MTNKLLIALLTLALLLTSGAASAMSPLYGDDAVTACLRDFTGEAEQANAFFLELHREHFTDSLVRFAADAPRDTICQQVWYWAADWYYDRQRYEEAERCASLALPLCRAGGNRTVEADCLNLLATIGIRLADYDMAARHARAAHALDLASGDPDRISSSLNTLAAIYMSARQPREAEKYIVKGIGYARQAGNPQRTAVLLGMASEVYLKLGDAARALDYATQAHTTELRQRRQDKAAVRQVQRAAALVSLGRSAEAKRALAEAIPTLRADDNRHSLGIACNQLGQILLDEGNDSAAARHFGEALDIFLAQHDLYNESRSRKGLYDALRRTAPAEAMRHIDRYNALRDSIYDSEAGMQLARYAAEYGSEELKDDLRTQRGTHRRTLMAVGIAALAAAGAWWAMRRRQQRRIRELLAQIQAAAAASPTGENRSEAPTRSKAAQEAAHAAGSPKGAEQEERAAFLRNAAAAVEAGMDAGKADLTGVAAKLCMSETTFRRALRAAAGQSPKAFISAVQMKRAAQLLTERPEMRIDDVARRCGFGEARSLNRAFKRTLGVTPTQYREQHEA